ncbi:hypothetical protein N7563_05635 [Leclercia adecarboxylata ATCC 23216 = NBRC 102595]|nr:hypothetical protein [Leclercia adecarboxylata ATCC 23216 = NBRC 102595]
MNIVQAQVAIFYDVKTPSDFDGLSYFLRKEVKAITGWELQNTQLFGGLPAEAPPEIPRLQLNSANNKLRVICSLQRFDFFYERSDNENDINLDVFRNLLDKIFEIHDNLGKKIIRVGLIAVKTVPDNSPVQTIAVGNLNAMGVGDFNGLSDVHLLYNRRFTLGERGFNCHITIMPGTDVNRGRPLLIKQIDVSSLEDMIFFEKYNAELIKQAFFQKIVEIN